MRSTALAFFAVVACGPVESPSPTPEPAAAPAGASDAHVRVPGYVGLVLADASVDVAPRIAGELAVVHVRPGDRVERGDVLATIVDSDAREAVRMAEAKLAVLVAAREIADVEVADATRRVATEQRLASTGAASTTDLEQAESSLLRAKAERAAAIAAHAEQRTVVDQRRRQLRETAIAAPFAGRIGQLYRDVGAAVAPAMPVARLVRTAGLHVRFAVPPARARQLAIAAAVSIEVETVEGPIRARVRQVAAEIDPASHLVFVDADLVDLEAVASALRPGMAARAWLDEP